MRKKFDKSLYDKYDAAAKTKLAEIFKGLQWQVKVSPKKMDVDFEVYKDGELVGYLETEVKLNWNTAPFPYSDVQWPERKWKYCSLGKPTIFMMFNHDLSEYLTAMGTDLLSSKLEMVRNKYIPYGENFFKVPTTKVIFNDITAALGKL